MKTESLTETASPSVDIITGKDEDGYHWEFTIDGNRYADASFWSRESALESARSAARAVWRGECPYTGKPLASK
jgi:hypothetical protein